MDNTPELNTILSTNKPKKKFTFNYLCCCKKKKNVEFSKDFDSFISALSASSSTSSEYTEDLIFHDVASLIADD